MEFGTIPCFVDLPRLQPFSVAAGHAFRADDRHDSLDDLPLPSNGPKLTGLAPQAEQYSAGGAAGCGAKSCAAQS